MSAALRNLVLCVEQPLYRRYLEEEFAVAGLPFTSVGREDLAAHIAEKPSGVLLLQSEAAEQNLLELSSKLKRLFGDEIRVLVLSSDYLSSEEASGSADAFLHFPAPFEEVEAALRRLLDTTRRLLLIDDSRLVHNHLVPPLREQGYEVFEAFDGQEGLEKAQACRPHLIICDIEMPRLNGFEACAAIRRTEELADTHIIMLSTLSSAADQQKGFEAGVDEYLTKPVVLAELLDRVKKALQRVRTGREHLLLLEGDDQLARAVVKALTRQGFSARTAATLKQAVRLLKRVGFDLVISEFAPADGSMLDLMAALKELPRERQPDVLILTARDSQADARMVQNAGAAGVISKPFTIDGLLAVVERALADRRAALERSQLEKYVSRASVRMALEKAILSGQGASARALRKQATIFFSDIAGFTSRCERYAPQEVVAQVNALFEVMTRVITEHQGDIDKFIGDACMAFWLNEDPIASATNALRATLRMREQIAVMNRDHPLLRADPIVIRVGINSGGVILCDLGAAGVRMDLTVIGDAVNLAARLESAAKQYGIETLVGEPTIAPVLDRFSARLIDWVKVKGKNVPVGCYELFAEKGQASERAEHLVVEFGAAIEAYRAGAFEQALGLFRAAEAFEKPGAANQLNPSRLFQDRCAYLLAHPPEEWDGSWTLKEK